MTLLFMDSCDHYISTQIGAKYFATNGCSIVSPGRNGGSALHSPGDSQYVIQLAGGNKSTVVLGAAIYIASSSIATSANETGGLFRIVDGSTIQCQISLKRDGTLQVQSGTGSPLTGGTSSPVISGFTWYYLEWKVTISTSISANTCQVKLNGTQIINVTAGQSTQATGNATADRFRLNGPGLDAYFDDIYFCDTNGSVNNNFLGDVSVVSLFPNANGDLSNFTNDGGNSVNNYTHVHENPADDDTTYVQDATPNDIDLYFYTTLSTTTSVLAVQEDLYAREDAAGTTHMQSIAKVSSTLYPSGITNSLGATYRYYLNILENNPSTTNPWAVSEVNASQFGIKVVT